YLAMLSNKALFVLVTTPDRIRLSGIGDLGPPKKPNHLREWSGDELHSLFQKFNFKPGFWGYTVNNNELLGKTTSLYIGGKLNGSNTEGTKDLKAVAIMSTFNEKDIALQNIHYHINQGFHVHVMDNWSDDDFFESISELAESSTSVTVERIPLERKENKYILKEQLDRKAAYAVESGFDWAIHVDADEFRHSPWDGVTFLEGIKIVDSLGFNAIDFSVLEFRPTRQGFSSKINPKEYFFHFEFAKVRGAFLQIKAWKINPEKDYDLSRNGGHHIHFEGQKIFPLKFENQHFAYRSLEQIMKKLYVERLPRIEEGLMKRGWHVHLVDFAVKHGVKFWDPAQLLTDSKLT
ncbi:MAG: glycosyltransferase family 2 protein, partial [Candidatus Heimdallarchaeota archaeon]|nr:glycosyltransferase family 2 protein [Candidatus Heimdallarchaeota archaeon]